MVHPRDDELQTLLIVAVPNCAPSRSPFAETQRAPIQDTLVKAWSNLSSFEKGSNLKAWRFTILRNTYFSELRKRRREVEDADGALAERMCVLPAQQVHMDVEDFNMALGSLSDDQKVVLLLVGAEGFSYAEAAEIAGAAVGS